MSIISTKVSESDSTTGSVYGSLSEDCHAHISLFIAFRLRLYSSLGSQYLKFCSHHQHWYQEQFLDL